MNQDQCEHEGTQCMIEQRLNQAERKLKNIKEIVENIRPADYDRSHPDVAVLLGKLIEILGLTMGCKVKGVTNGLSEVW